MIYRCVKVGNAFASNLGWDYVFQDIKSGEYLGSDYQVFAIKKYKDVLEVIKYKSKNFMVYSIVKTDENNYIHAIDGPAIENPGGLNKYYYLHGVLIYPEDVFSHLELLNENEIDTLLYNLDNWRY